eukprot:2648807-Rhodomonas_salina.2
MPLRGTAGRGAGGGSPGSSITHISTRSFLANARGGATCQRRGARSADRSRFHGVRAWPVLLLHLSVSPGQKVSPIDCARGEVRVPGKGSVVTALVALCSLYATLATKKEEVRAGTFCART